MTLKNVSVGALKSLKITEGPQNKQPLLAHTKTSIPSIVWITLHKNLWAVTIAQLQQLQ